MNLNNLSVFLPAFNEEKNIASTIKNVDEAIKKLKIKNYEILVINDGSKDNTAKVVSEIAQKNKHLRLVNHPKNLGYGGALKTGFKESKYAWVAFTDSDGQFDFNEITKFLEYTDSADLILGYRLTRADSLSRKIFTFGWKTIAFILLGLDVKDYSTGFKLIKRKVFEDVSPLKTEEKVTQIEFLVKAKRQGFKFAEVGVHHYPRKFGEQTGANLTVVLKSISDLFSLWKTL